MQAHAYQAGDVELKEMGQWLHGYLKMLGGRVEPPSYLHVAEHAQRGEERCSACGESINMGTFCLDNRDDALRIEMPYLAVHAAAVHGDEHYSGSVHEGGLIDTQRLAEVLNYEEHLIGKILTRRLAQVSQLFAHLAVKEHAMRGVVPCAECGDWVNMGYFAVTNRHNNAQVEVPYLALHGLVEHRDAHYGTRWSALDRNDLDEAALWADKPVTPRGHDDHHELDKKLLRRVLGHSRAYETVGQRVQSFLRQAGGHKKPPRHLEVEEHPLRGFEACVTCGEKTNMGWIRIRNRGAGRSIKLPYMAVHFLVMHGDAYYRGDLHSGWVDMVALTRILRRHVRKPRRAE